jgi:hypothetical protein
VIDQQFSLADTPAAIGYVEARGAKGKVVINVR